MESLSFPLESAFEETLSSLNDWYAGKSYWVFIDYERPLNSSIHQAKRDMEAALRDFLRNDVVALPCEISVNSKIKFSIDGLNPGGGELFSVGGLADSEDVDGLVQFIWKIFAIVSPKNRLKLKSD